MVHTKLQINFQVFTDIDLIQKNDYKMHNYFRLVRSFTLCVASSYRAQIIRDDFQLDTFSVDTKAGFADLVTASDTKVEKFIFGAIREKYPEHRLLLTLVVMLVVAVVVVVVSVEMVAVVVAVVVVLCDEGV